MKKILSLFIIILLISGCDRYIDSAEITQDLPDSPPIPTALKIGHTSDGILLTWQVADTTGVARYRVYIGDSLNDHFILRDSSLTESLEITDLIDGHRYYFKVSTVMRGNLEGNKSATISTAFGAISVVIEDNDGYVRTRSIGISFVVPGVATLMQISENIDFVGAAWLVYNQSTEYTLSEGDGLKRVYARFRFSDGSELDEAVSDSTTLDTRAIIDSTYFIAESAILTAGEAVTFFVAAGETGGTASISFTGLSSLELNDDGLDGDLVSGDGLYSREYVVPINLEISNGLVTGRFTDIAGNEADSRPAVTLINIAKSPTPVSLTAIAETSASIKLTWSSSTESDFSAYQIYRGSSGTVSNNSSLITIITSKSTTTYTDEDLTSSTGYFYRVYVYDNTGRFGASNVASDTTPVNLAPAAVHLAIRSVDSASYLTWTTNDDDDFDSYMIYRDIAPGVDTTSQLLTIINSSAATSFDDIRPNSSTNYYYKIYVFDRQGLATGSNEVSVP